MPFLTAHHLNKSYQVGTQHLHVLRDLDLSIEAGEMVAVVGASGVGKSTLLHMLGGLDRADSGAISVGSTDIVALLLEHHAYIDAESPSGLTPLMIAAREGQEAVVEQLLIAGADAMLVDSENLTASQIARRADKPRIASAIERHLAALQKPK